MSDEIEFEKLSVFVIKLEIVGSDLASAFNGGHCLAFCLIENLLGNVIAIGS